MDILLRCHAKLRFPMLFIKLGECLLIIANGGGGGGGWCFEWRVEVQFSKAVEVGGTIFAIYQLVLFNNTQTTPKTLTISKKNIKLCFNEWSYCLYCQLFWVPCNIHIP